MRIKDFRDGDNIQFFLTYGRVTKVKPISNQCISKWQVMTIKCAYATHDLDAPQEIKGHQMRKQAIFIAEMAGIDLQLICQAATWVSSSILAK